jgi:hypothetical protein
VIRECAVNVLFDAASNGVGVGRGQAAIDHKQRSRSVLTVLPSWSCTDGQAASQSNRFRMIASGLARTQHGGRQGWLCGKGCPDTEGVIPTRFLPHFRGRTVQTMPVIAGFTRGAYADPAHRTRKSRAGPAGAGEQQAVRLGSYG